MRPIPTLGPSLSLLALGCVAPAADPDPTQGEVQLEAPADWNATLALDLGAVGIWTVLPLQVFPQYASPEIVALDDLGRCHVLVSYSGKWTPRTTIEDGVWLGGLAQGDVDPGVPGNELYVGGKSGNVFQVAATRNGQIVSRLLGNLGGREVHTLAAGDLLPGREGGELIAFTAPGGLWLLTPGAGGEFEVELVRELPGRVRDAAALPAQPGERPGLVTVSRDGRLELLTWGADGPRWLLIHELPIGMGRVALDGSGPGLAIYNTCDDGTIWRHERQAEGGFDHELIYAGPQGPRGIAVGRFFDDPEVEGVAVFGYSARVELLTRGRGGWNAETIFVDRDKGHWLAAAELDGRNATRELVLSGYGGRVVVLARPAGYGLGVLSELSPRR